MRILLDYRPALRQRTGVGEYVHELARAIVASSPRAQPESLTLFSSSWKDRLASDVVPGAAVIDRRLPVQVLNFLWHRVGRPSAEWLTGQSFDVVHSAHPIRLPSRSAAQVVTVHDLDFLEHPERTRDEIRRDYPSLAPPHIRAADAVAVVSKHTAAEVRRLTGVAAEHIFVCPLGRPDWRCRDQEPASAPLLFFGTVEPRKNVGLLLDAYARLLERRRTQQRPTPRLVLAGGPGLGADALLHQARTPPLADHVDVLGYVSPDDRYGLYASALACIMPSHTEGFGLPALEAMTVGVPVVAANRGALPEVVGDAGLLFPAGDVEALTAALETVIDNPARRTRMREAGLIQSAEFTWAKTAERTREAWHHAVRRRSERG